MPYRTMGWIHANVVRVWRDQTGQGTVEYVGPLMLLLAALLTGVVAVAHGLKGGGVAEQVAKTLKETISNVGHK